LPRVTLKQSGGFAGIEQEPVRVEADRLAPAVRERLPALLAAPPPEVAGADLRALADEVRRQAGG
jgi:hypothetical protein